MPMTTLYLMIKRPGYFNKIMEVWWSALLVITLISNGVPEEQIQTSGSPPPAASSKHFSLSHVLLPWLPFVMLILLYSVWVKFSPTDIMEREPRLLLFSMGVLFSNITVSVTWD